MKFSTFFGDVQGPQFVLSNQDGVSVEHLSFFKQKNNLFAALLMLMSLQFSHYSLHCRMLISRNRLVTIPMPSSSLLSLAVLSRHAGGWTENLWDATESRYRSTLVTCSQCHLTKQYVASNSFDVRYIDRVATDQEMVREKRSSRSGNILLSQVKLTF